MKSAGAHRDITAAAAAQTSPAALLASVGGAVVTGACVWRVLAAHSPIAKPGDGSPPAKSRRPKRVSGRAQRSYCATRPMPSAARLPLRGRMPVFGFAAAVAGRDGAAAEKAVN